MTRRRNEAFFAMDKEKVCWVPLDLPAVTRLNEVRQVEKYNLEPIIQQVTGQRQCDIGDAIIVTTDTSVLSTSHTAMLTHH